MKQQKLLTIQEQLIESYLDGVYDGLKIANKQLKDNGFDFEIKTISRNELKKKKLIYG